MPTGSLEMYKDKACNRYASVCVPSACTACRKSVRSLATSILHLLPYNYGIFDATSKHYYYSISSRTLRACKRTGRDSGRETSCVVPGPVSSGTSLGSLVLDTISYSAGYAALHGSINYIS